MLFRSGVLSMRLSRGITFFDLLSLLVIVALLLAVIVPAVRKVSSLLIY